MEIILKKDVDNLGYTNDIVKVKPGYARNFLIPQGLAVIANAKNRAVSEKIQAEEAAQEAARVEEYKGYDAKLQGQTLTIATKAGTSGKIFGSVTNVQIVQGLKEQFGIEVARKKVTLLQGVKDLGSYTAEVRFHDTVVTQLAFDVVQEGAA